MSSIFKIMFVLMGISLLIVFIWDSVPFIKNTVNSILDPSAGVLLNWNITWGMLILISIIALITTLIQKYVTDQKALRELKQEQKELQKEMRKYSQHPEKMLELNKQSFSIMPKIMSITMKGTMVTMIPFVLLFRWFLGYFSEIPDFRFFGFLGWIWFYLIFIVIFTSIFKKLLKVV